MTNEAEIEAILKVRKLQLEIKELLNSELLDNEIFADIHKFERKARIALVDAMDEVTK